MGSGAVMPYNSWPGRLQSEGDEAEQLGLRAAGGERDADVDQRIGEADDLLQRRSILPSREMVGCEHRSLPGLVTLPIGKVGATDLGMNKNAYRGHRFPPGVHPADVVPGHARRRDR